jgi:hypothetical protein
MKKCSLIILRKGIRGDEEMKIGLAIKKQAIHIKADNLMEWLGWKDGLV